MRRTSSGSSSPRSPPDGRPPRRPSTSARHRSRRRRLVTAPGRSFRCSRRRSPATGRRTAWCCCRTTTYPSSAATSRSSSRSRGARGSAWLAGPRARLAGEPRHHARPATVPCASDDVRREWPARRDRAGVGRARHAAPRLAWDGVGDRARVDRPAARRLPLRDRRRDARHAPRQGLRRLRRHRATRPRASEARRAVSTTGDRCRRPSRPGGRGAVGPRGGSTTFTHREGRHDPARSRRARTSSKRSLSFRSRSEGDRSS